MNNKNSKIAVVGLGYVGLPLALEFSKIREVIGFDINKKRVKELQNSYDSTLEVSSDDLQKANELEFSSNIDDLKECGIFIVTVPTPVDDSNRPNLIPLIKASEIIGGVMKRGSIVIYESTVYPGATEEICVPVLERSSGFIYNKDFYCGYSPERINPGDKVRTLTTIQKITSGSTNEVAEIVGSLYASIIKAGIFKAQSMKVAEAAKVIENTQRDLNIALVNELSLIFNRLGIDTLEVIEAASTKWNFLPFRPGLVGGHCIGIDPYYLTHKAQEVGYYPEVILAGRRVNSNIVHHVAHETIRLMLCKNISVAQSRILILGLTFKENCPDLRNTKIIDLVRDLEGYNTKVDVYDPWIDLEEAKSEYGLDCLPSQPIQPVYSAIILAVAHKQFLELGISGIRGLGNEKCIIFDVKGAFPKEKTDARL